MKGSSSNNNNSTMYANRHIPRFLAYSSNGSDKSIKILDDGSKLTADALKEGILDISRPVLVLDTPESIGLKPFKAKEVSDGAVSVRHVADVLGHSYPIRVMDVEHQEELQGWTLGEFVEFVEDPDRLKQKQHIYMDEQKNNGWSVRADIRPNMHRLQRKAALKASTLLLTDQNKPKVLNQISLEFSGTPLQELVLSPQFVRDLDWVGNCWPADLRRDKQSYPSVQYYCLTSTAGCYTDFHIDFGGTSVWYHVLSGSKQFCLITPTKQNLAIYEEWLGHHDQESIFLPDLIPNQSEVLTTALDASQTLFIPTG